MIPWDWIATPQERAARFPSEGIWILRFAGYSRDDDLGAAAECSASQGGALQL